jgi:hypothetical protein
MPEGTININAVGVFRTGDVNFDVTWDLAGKNPVTQINWGEFKDWNPDDWKSMSSGGNFYRPSSSNVLIGDSLTTARINCVVAALTPQNLNIEADVTALQTSKTVPEEQLIVRYKDEGNYYFAGIGAWGYKGGIGKVVASKATMIAHTQTSGTKSGIKVGQQYKLKVSASGNYIYLYIDGQYMCWANDATLTSGKVGVTSFKSKVQYDNFKAYNKDGTVGFQDNFGDYKKTTDFYIVNKEIVPLVCTASALNIIPTELTDNIDITWDLNTSIGGNTTKKVKLQMDILPDAPAGNFSYSMVINGKTA